MIKENIIFLINKIGLISRKPTIVILFYWYRPIKELSIKIKTPSAALLLAVFIISIYSFQP